MKNLIKKISLTLLFLTIFGCGQSEDKKESAKPTTTTNTKEVKPEEGAQIKVWESKGPEMEWLKYVGNEFQKKYGVKVTYESVQMTDTITRLQQDGPAGTGADVVVIPHDRIGSGVTSGVIMPNLLTTDRINKDFLPAAKTAVTWKDGKMYGFPLAIETYVLFYNKNLLPNGVKTFEELKTWNTTNKFTDRTKNKFALAWEICNLYYAEAFLASDGGYLIGENGTNPKDIGANNPGAVKGINNMLTLKDLSVANPADLNYDSMMGLFREGKIACMINGPWAIEGLKKAKVNFGIQILPTLNNTQLNPFSGVRTLAVSSYTKFPKASQLFAQFATSDEMLKKRFEMTNQIPPVLTLANAPEIASNPYVAPVLEQAKHSTPMPSIPEMGLFWDPLSAALSDIYLGKASTQDGLNKAVKIISDQINTQK